LVEAIKACDQALVVLKEYNPNAANFAQLRAVAQRLEKAQVFTLSKKSVDAPTASQLNALKEFLQQAQGAESFLSIPGYRSFSPQSGQIFGVLEQMKEDFEKDLSDARASEKKAVEDFEALRAAKQEELTAGRTFVIRTDGQIAELKAKHAQAFKELEDTQAQLALDREFLASLKKKCAETDAEFEKRTADRLTEIKAVDDTIVILNSDTSFDNFEATVNTAFLQAKSHNQHQESQQQRAQLLRTASALASAAARLNSPQLALLATSAQLDTFTKVKELIDKMVAELSKQQKDEIAHKDWCIDELARNKRSTEAAYDKKDNLMAKIADIEKSIAYLTKEIDAATAAVAEMQEQMKRASEVREAENADYHQTMTDQRMTQMILDKALKRMSEVYAFLQRQGEEPEQPGGPHIHTSGNHTNAGNGPARFSNYVTNAGGSRVLRMLEGVRADSQKMEDDAIHAEEDAQSAYENFMKDSNKAITQTTRKIVNMEGMRATDKEDLSLTNSDLKATLAHLEELHETLGSIKGSCDYILNNFDARQTAREAEIQALKEAKAILSGSK